MSLNNTVDAQFASAGSPLSSVSGNYTLSISRLGKGTGTVTSSPAGINCGVDCYESYANITLVALTANAAADSVFVGWSGACSGVGRCTINVAANRGVNAIFSLKNVDARQSKVSVSISSLFFTRKYVKVKVRVTDVKDMTSVNIYIDNVLKKTCTRSRCSYFWNIKKEIAGRHIVKGTATDVFGNVETATLTMQRV
jgi:hypothetical protein